ncbi:hypothetical protein [Planobispora longispora]|uniref:Uncharacterized protein n=1 Tax=Planobispora longispora TaxID=28887 RepID=A0A8J3RSW0_9ACTN|nr:hypothetical protein [Planobispora longispora]BFE88175.1 hypothetical protein GCM10020093_107760 [Planobispora longispora]GIH81187.1 hypothetical protein Plo01_76160 [Planobispora longispora]
MLSIRLTGTPAEVADAVLTLRETFPIAAVKGLCPTVPAEPCIRVYVQIGEGPS